MSKLQEIVTEEYLAREIDVQPTYPRVLVRLLPREQESKGGIIMPEGQAQNKPNLEGIVLAVYKPFWKTLVKSDRENWERNSSKKLLVDEVEGQLEVRKIWMEAPVTVGDHVIFPSMEFGICPVWPLDEGKGDYRLVPEEHIQGILTYEKESTVAWLAALLEKEFVIDSQARHAALVLENAYVIRKDLKARMVSGK